MNGWEYIIEIRIDVTQYREEEEESGNLNAMREM